MRVALFQSSVIALVILAMAEPALCGWQNFTSAGGLASDYVSRILEDRAGNLWFGTYGGGVSRYDGATWRTYSTADGLADNHVSSILEDRAGNLWFGTDGGVSRYDGSTWRTFTTADGLASNDVSSILEDRAGNLWFGTYGGGGVSRYDGSTWRTFGTADGLASDDVSSILEDRAGHLWFGTGATVSRYDGSSWQTFIITDGRSSVTCMLEDRAGNLWFGAFGLDGLNGYTAIGGVTRYDGSTWQTFTTADGLANDGVFSILEDRAGNLWFGTFGGVSRYNGSIWRTFTTTDGLAVNCVNVILEDRAGNLWFGTCGRGASRYDGSAWRTFTTADGLAGNLLRSLLEDRAGNLWLGTELGASRYEPDRVPPRTVFLSSPPRVSSTRNQNAVFVAAFGEARIEFSYRFDDSAWSNWSSISSWFGNDLLDGMHVLEVRSRDFLSNMDSSAVTFEVDATPPVPVIASPASGQAVKGIVGIRGSATDARFERYGVAFRRAGASTWDPEDATSLVVSTTPAPDGPLATWDTSSLPDGSYEIRLAVEDTLGLTASTLVTVRVDNQAPFDDQTAPARVVATTGGDIYTLNGELHLYFPPHAFGADARVTINPVAPGSVPETLPTGALRVMPGFDVGWQGSTLEKPARLELSLAGVDQGSLAGPPAIHHSADGATWERLGGTVEGERITLAVSAGGRYALFAGGTSPAGNAALSSLSFTPRVFSPSGTFSDRRVGIAFTLGRPGSVTVRVHDRAGWVVREVARGLSLGEGSNLVWWDGTDRGGRIVADGLYLVTVEALGETHRRTLAVVR